MTTLDDLGGPAAATAPGLPRSTSVVVNPHLHIVRCSDDEIVVKHGSRSMFSEIIADTERTGLLGRVLDRLRSPGCIDQLLGEGLLNEEDCLLAAGAMQYLFERGVLVPAEHDLTKVYIDTFLGTDRRLADARIGIVGDGTVAARIATSMKSMGLGQVDLLDDTTEPGAARETPSESELDRVFGTHDFVVLALDGFSPKALHATNSAAISAGVPWMSVFFDGSEAVIGPTYVPGETCCYFEFEFQHEASLTLKNEYVLFKEAAGTAGGPRGFVLPPYAEVAAGFGATSAIEFLTSGKSFTIERAVRINFERASIDYQDVLRLPRCPACATKRAPYRHLFL